jgi:hypothetical protein
MSESNGHMDFDAGRGTLAPIQIPVKFRGKNYVLCEPDEGGTCEWKNRNLQEAEYRDGRLYKVGKLADGEPFLVSRCLYHANAEGQPGNLVSLIEIRSWPPRVVNSLFEKAKEIGDLNDVNPDDPDPELIGMCRKHFRDTSLSKSPDYLDGVDAALNWLRENTRNKVDAKARAKNSPGATADISA